MSEDNPPGSPRVLAADARQLLEMATALEPSLSQRATIRTRLVADLGAMIGADGGFWAWGMGHPLRDNVTPLSTITFGFDEQEWFALANVGMSDEATRWYRAPFLPLLETASQACGRRSSFWSDEEWHASRLFRDDLAPRGWENWLICIRYVATDSWCCLSMHRRLGRPDFTERDVAVADLAMGSIAYFQAKPSELVTPEATAQLTPRQRTVLLCLFDGYSRKEIASRLGITLNTANDHIKAIFEHFAVNSTTELASKFLKVQ